MAMPTSKNPPQRRDYKKEEHYEDSPAQVKHREERNLLRAHTAKRLGHNPAGDVAHIKPLDREGRNTLGNSRVESVAKNRSWRKGQRGYHVPDDV
jgi:hypothetical protein